MQDGEIDRALSCDDECRDTQQGIRLVDLCSVRRTAQALSLHHRLVGIHYFKAPAVKPPMNCREKMMYNPVIGIIARLNAANSADQSCLY